MTPTQPNKRAYATTTVSADKSMGEVMALLRKRGASGLQWSEEGKRTTLRFHWRSGAGADLCAKFTLNIEVAPPKKTATVKQMDDLAERERKRLFRVLAHFLKNLFEAVDGGLLTAEEALLPYLEDATGKTVGELLVPRLSMLASGPLTRALGPGRDKVGA